MNDKQAVAQLPLREALVIAPPVVERLALEKKPRAITVSSYFPTRAARRALQRINRELSERTGKVFWISGPAGAGKTHFLNYVLALEERAGSPQTSNGRRMTFGLETPGQVRGAEVEAHVLEALAARLSRDTRGGSVWREMRGPQALKVALEQARRVGFVAVTGAIDFGVGDPSDAAEYVATLSEVAASFKTVKFSVIAASRPPAPKAKALPLQVAPADAAEAAAAAVNRVRILSDHAARDFGQLAGDEPSGLATIFPFHPRALNALQALADPPTTIAAIAALVREVLLVLCAPQPGGPRRLIYPGDLLASPAVMKRVQLALGSAGTAALKIAHNALTGLDGNHRKLADEIVSTLVVNCAAGNQKTLASRELETLVPMLAHPESRAESAATVTAELLRKLSERTNGVIRYQSGAARFDPEAAGARDLAAFNSALGLARKFDPALSELADKAEVDLEVSHLADAMALAVENAERVRIALAAALKEAGAEFMPENREALENYSALALAGASALLETAADPSRRESALHTLARYDTLARAAGMIPQMRAMREYLEATGLRIADHEDPAKGPRIAALETECELLAAELGPRLLTNPLRSLDALEARFEKFKWTYVLDYLGGHEKWRAEMQRLSPIADDLRRHLEALSRLNAIPTLGAPQGEELGALAAEISSHIIHCESRRIPAEVTPRCAVCNYLVGAVAPSAQLAELMERTRRALSIKLAALSQSAIARIVSKHDRAHRLDGFLKITQAAQTDALVRVLDEKLALYLARLLDENLGGEATDPDDRRSPMRDASRPRRVKSPHS